MNIQDYFNTHYPNLKAKYENSSWGNPNYAEELAFGYFVEKDRNFDNWNTYSWSTEQKAIFQEFENLVEIAEYNPEREKAVEEEIEEYEQQKHYSAKLINFIYNKITTEASLNFDQAQELSSLNLKGFVELKGDDFAKDCFNNLLDKDEAIEFYNWAMDRLIDAETEEDFTLDVEP